MATGAIISKATAEHRIHVSVGFNLWPDCKALQKFHHYVGDDFKVECPTGSGDYMTLWEVGAELSRRLTRIFLADDGGMRPVHGASSPYQTDPNWRDLVLFYKYFHGDDGSGVGASHQTGWTGLVGKLLQQSGE